MEIFERKTVPVKPHTDIKPHYFTLGGTFTVSISYEYVKMLQQQSQVGGFANKYARITMP